MHDIKYAIRVLLRSPAFTLAVILVLGLGIGATTAIFSIVDQVLLRPLPFHDADRLYALRETDARDPAHRGNASNEETYTAFRECRAFEDIGAEWGRPITLTGAGPAQWLPVELLSPNMFRMLGVSPILGRTFLDEEDRTGAPDVTVISESLWRETFGSDPEIVGNTITLDDRGFRVVGVMPASFNGPYHGNKLSLWLPMWQRGGNPRAQRVVTPFGRLRSGATKAEAQAQAGAITARFGHTVVIEPLRELWELYQRPQLLIMLAAVVLVLLIACANVANLLLARGAGRAKEIVVRAALGASRARLILHAAAESIVLALVSCAAGLLFAMVVLKPLLALNSDLPHGEVVTLDVRVLGFTLVVSYVTAVFCGLFPAIEATRVDLHRGIKEGAAQASGGVRANRIRRILIASESALSLILLAGAATMVQSFLRVRPSNPGFETRNRLVLRVVLPQSRYPQPELRAAFARRWIEELKQAPGVRDAAVSSGLPLSGVMSFGAMTIERRQVNSFYQPVSEDYFSTMEIPLRRGHLFDGNRSAAVASQAFAQEHFSGNDPIGRTVAIETRDGTSTFTITGVTTDVKWAIGQKPWAGVYVPFDQMPSSAFQVVMSSAAPAMSLLPEARRTLRIVDPNQPIQNVTAMGDMISDEMASVNYRTLLMSALAAFALLLAAVGIYAVMAYNVAQRTREIGIRVALGARRRDVLRLVARGGMVEFAAGIALGSFGAWAGVRLLVKAFYLVFPLSLGIFAAVAAALVMVAISASLLPAIRAAKLDPIAALREE
jgi:putative ABC transport system permease protein